MSSPFSAAAALRVGFMLIILAIAAAALLTSSASRGPQPASASPAAALTGLPLYFVENRGQLDSRVGYYTQGEDASFYFTRGGLALSLADRTGTGRDWNLKLDFVGANPAARPTGSRRTSAEVSYFGGGDTGSHTGLPTYGRVVYQDVWPGIDLVYSGKGGRLKYSFLVSPGADPSDIRLGWRGASGVRLNGRGQLRVATPAGPFVDDAPRSYQSVGGRRVAVSSSYLLSGGGEYGFRVQGHDPNRPLVIDPAVLVYAGYIGGSRDEAANNVAVDRRGNLYVTGGTSSPARFPDRVGPDRSYNGGPSDVFVAKVDPSGRRLRWAGYIGGSGDETGIGVAVDRRGAVYVGGATSSTEATFPVKAGPDVTYNGGSRDAFVAKLSPSGRRLVFAGYIGGSQSSPPGFPNEQTNGIDVDAGGNVYLAGFTNSSEAAGFPVTAGSFDTSFNGLVDTWAAKLRADGGGFRYATFIGGSGVDPGTGLAVDRAGNAYVNGFAGSDQETFPDGDGFGAIASFDRTHNSPDMSPVPSDAYVAKLNASGTALVYAGYIGGAGVEQPFGNALDRRGNLYLTGYTNSTQATFPDGNGFGGLRGPDRTYNGGQESPGGDAFVAKVNRAGTALDYAGYVGGARDDTAVAIAVDRAGSAHIFGDTESNQRSFPVRRGPDRSYNGGPSDAFVAKLTPSGGGLDYAGYIGGSGAETGIGVAVDAAGSAYVAGNSDSNQRTFPVRGGPDRTFNGPFGDTDAFVAKISEERCLGRPVTVVGTPGRDRLVGTRGRDVIAGLGGDDVLRALGGNDLLCGGSGRDRLDGGSGSNRLDGGPGRDRCSGGRSKDC